MTSSKFEFFESGEGLLRFKQGIISVDWLTKYNTYKVFLELKNKGLSRAESVRIASERCKCDVSTVARHIQAFEE
jgi:hypothetical protein